MCITRNELEKKIEELRSLKALKEETENELKALEHEVISYMTENELTEEITNNAKITYKPQSRTTLDKAKLTEVLGDDLKSYEKVTTYSVLLFRGGQFMYRQYENPNRLEAELQRLKEEYCIAVEKGADEDTLINLHFAIDDLEERVNHAWQDDEE